jgi:small subunit ribosomal protein S20
MPVTKTAKRALRVSKRKGVINKKILGKLEIAIRTAKKSRTSKNITNAISLVDRAAKKNVLHKNKASRIKSTISKLLLKSKTSSSKHPRQKKA